MHGFLSSQLTGAWMHLPEEQLSAVQAFPSSQLGHSKAGPHNPVFTESAVIANRHRTARSVDV